MQREFYTAAEVAPAVGVTSGRIYQLIGSGEIPATRVGRRLRIPREAWERWLAAKQQEATSELQAA
ncbi:MAG: excisionase family DNA-binding protein [Actinomycetota bacterium]